MMLQDPMAMDSSAVRQRHDHPPLPVFIHLPKTAGYTLGIIIRMECLPHSLLGERYRFHFVRNPQELEAFGQWCTRLSPTTLNRLKLLYGHIIFHYNIEQFLSKPCRYFTFLRDPVERVISHYYFYVERVLQRGKTPISLETFVRSPENQNLQTQWLTTSAGIQGTPQQMLEAAIANLESRFFFVGITERFDESILMLKSLLQWRMPYYIRLNETKSRPATDQLQHTALDLIREHNQLDQLLYEYGLQRFNTCLAQQGPGFYKTLSRFRKINPWVGLIYTPGFHAVKPFLSQKR